MLAQKICQILLIGSDIKKFEKGIVELGANKIIIITPNKDKYYSITRKLVKKFDDVAETFTVPIFDTDSFNFTQEFKTIIAQNFMDYEIKINASTDVRNWKLLSYFSITQLLPYLTELSDNRIMFYEVIGGDSLPLSVMKYIKPTTDEEIISLEKEIEKTEKVEDKKAVKKKGRKKGKDAKGKRQGEIEGEEDEDENEEEIVSEEDEIRNEADKEDGYDEDDETVDGLTDIDASQLKAKDVLAKEVEEFFDDGWGPPDKRPPMRIEIYPIDRLTSTEQHIVDIIARQEAPMDLIKSEYTMITKKEVTTGLLSRYIGNLKKKAILVEGEKQGRYKTFKLTEYGLKYVLPIVREE